MIASHPRRAVARGICSLFVSLLALLPPAVAGANSDPANRCALSRVYVGPLGSLRPASDADAAAVLDEDDATALRLDARAGEIVQWSFIGAPRWLNRLEVSIDAPDVGIELLGVDDVWRPYGRRESPPGTGGLSTVAIAGEDAYVQGIRVIPSRESAVLLTRVAARFVSIDPDDAVLGTGDEGTKELHLEWVNHYDNYSDLSACDNDAHGLDDALPGGWTTYEHGDANAREEHLTAVAYGGINNSHVDVADLSYQSSHGGSGFNDVVTGTDLGSILFDDDTHDDDNVTPSEINSAWGDTDMEWFAMSTCQTLRDAGQGYWANGMSTQHLICGSEDNISDSNYGDDFGDEMVDNGIFDSAEQVKDAWFECIDDHNGGHDIAVVIGENSTMGSDYLSGEGTVHSDPVVDCCYTVWEYDVGAVAPDRALPASAPASDAIVSAPTTENGISVIFSPSLRTAVIPSQLPTFTVVQTPHDSFYVRGIAQDICQTEQVLCGGDIGPGNPGELNLIQGLRELRVCTASGGFRYTDAGNWLAWRTAKPTLLLGDAAVSRAEALLQTWGRRPPDASVLEVHYLWQRALVRSTGPPIEQPESTFAIASEVRYRRMLAGYPVVGPGGSMTLGFGHGGALQRVHMNAWRPVMQGPAVTLVPIDSVVAELNAAGSAATINGISVGSTGLVINSYDAGYYEPHCHEMPTMIHPCYILHCTVIGVNGAQVPADIYVLADAMPPRARIVSPPDRSYVPIGSTVCFKGAASSGMPPYSFTWTSDAAVVGTGDSLCLVATLPATGEGDMDSTRSLTLIATDAKGNTGYADVTLYFYDPATGVGDVAASRRLALTAIAPNPTRGTVRIDYAVGAGAVGSEPVALRIFDIAGRQVRVLLIGDRPPGAYTAFWNGRDELGRLAPPGVYTVRLESAGRIVTRKLVLVR